MTIADRIKAVGGHTSGFDYLRVILAVSVLAWHSFPLSHGANAAASVMTTPLGPFVRLILPMFFALSGFLVAASLERNPLDTFLVFRGLRIVPALFVEIVLSALVLGPLLTTPPLRSYFTGHQFATYFLNVVGYIHYELPGVFTNNPFPTAVNGSLWTVPYELECYAALIVLAVLGIMRKPALILGITLLGGFFILEVASYRDSWALKLDSAVPGRALVLCFLAGTWIYSKRDHIPLSMNLFIASLIMSVAMLSIPTLYVFVALPAAYATVWLGLHNFPRSHIVLSGDYSYGIYLYAFPIQQTAAYLIPGVNYFTLLFVSLAGTSAFAFMSWHLVEKHALKLKRAAAERLSSWRKTMRENMTREETEDQFDARQW